MCGITGFITTSNNYNPDLYSNKLISMMNSLNHRGPDSKNFIIDNESFLGLAHTRLSIQDLSINGNQPMESFSKKYMIIFNGEIYNHFELRKYIDAQSNNIIKWRGTSDTETLINAVKECEDAALSVKGITNSEGAGASYSKGEFYLATSNGVISANFENSILSLISLKYFKSLSPSNNNASEEASKLKFFEK